MLNRPEHIARMKWDVMGTSKGIWTTNEDNIVLERVQTALSHGLLPNFAEISKAVNRAPQSIRKRWRSCLDPALKRGEPWTSEEDESIRKFVSEAVDAGKCLPSAMIGRMLSRPAHDVRHRWNRVLSKREGNESVI